MTSLSRFFSFLMVGLYSTISLAGGTGSSGGSPPAKTVSQEQFNEIAIDASNGYLLEVRDEDGIPTYFEPINIDRWSQTINAKSLDDESEIIIKSNRANALLSRPSRFKSITPLDLVEDPSISTVLPE